MFLTTIDAVQTSEIRKNPCLEENDVFGQPMMGKQPSDKSIAVYFISWFVVNMYIEDALKGRGAPKWVRSTYRIVSDALLIGRLQRNQYWVTDVWNDPAIDHHICGL